MYDADGKVEASYRPGDVLECDDIVAFRWLRRQVAEDLDQLERTQPKPAEDKPAPAAADMTERQAPVTAKTPRKRQKPAAPEQ